MTVLPRITTFAWVPEFARGFVRDLRPRWAFEEVGQAYEVELIRAGKTTEHRRRQPFGQVPTYEDDEAEIFESGAIVLRIAERAGKLIPTDPAAPDPRDPVARLRAQLDRTMGDGARRERCVRGRSPLVARRATGRSSTICMAGCAISRPRLAIRTWIDGDTFTVGDLMLVSVLGGLRGTGQLDGFPRNSRLCGARRGLGPRIARPWPTSSRFMPSRWLPEPRQARTWKGEEKMANPDGSLDLVRADDHRR